jgi:hypothetical protein
MSTFEFGLVSFVIHSGIRVSSLFLHPGFGMEKKPNDPSRSNSETKIPE